MFRYPGGKTKLKTRIIEKLAEFKKTEYREPFFGGGGVGLSFLTKNQAQDVWLNDKDTGIFCLWHSVMYEHERLKDVVRYFVPVVNDFYAFKKELLDAPDNPENKVYYGFLKLAIHQISYSGLGTKSGGPLGGKNQSSKYKIDCRWSPDYICSKIDKMHNLFKRFNTKFTNLDFQELISDIQVDSLIYLDPPYYVKGNDLYQYGFTLDDHNRLCKLLQDTKHTWVLSYDDCPEIRELYKWAKIEELNAIYSITGSRKKTSC
jgi:DNA adenine methylase